MKEMTVLLVDDEERILHALARNLKSQRFKQIYVNSAADALQAFKQEPIHVLVTDIMMPGMSGLELLKIVREEYPETVRLIFSGQNELNRVVTAINSGEVFRYIAKPAPDGETVSRLIHEAIDFYLLRRDRGELIERLRTKNAELEESLEAVKQLQGLLPICAMCKKIRSDTDQTYWMGVEKYIEDHSDAKFTHCFCPDCYNKHFADELGEISEDTDG
jgi:DNA-binding NtrC family response regulator